MKQKLLFFFLTAFLSLTGGGKLWAGSYVISYSNISSQSSVQNGSNYDYTATLNNGLTVTYTRSESGKNLSKGSSDDYIKYSNNYHYTVSGIPATETITSIEFYGYANSQNSTANIFLNNEDTGKTFVSTTDKPVTSQLVEELTLTGGFEFHVSGAESGIKITITTEETTIDKVFNSTYPYTWQFDVEAAKWTKSKSQITANTTDWVVMSSGNEARNKVTTAITVNDIDICKGLTFQADAVSADASSTLGGICLDWTYRQLWMNGKLTIPNLKVGMKVKFTSNDNVTATEESTGRVSGSGKEFTVTTAGDVTFRVNTHVQAIAVTKTDIATIGVSGGSATTAVVGSDPMNIIIVFRNESTNILTMSAEEWASCTVTNSDDAVITVSKGGHSTSSGGDGRGNITVTPVAAGTSTVTISFPGSDRYNAKEGTITFTITKKTQTLSFAEAAKYVNYGQAAPTNTLTQTPAEGGGEVTYSSSKPHVATVDAKTGALAIHNAGTCTITATAAETTTYGEATAYYTLTVNTTETAPTITMTQNPGTSQPVEVADGGTVTTTFGNTVTVQGTCDPSGPTVKYRSSNTSVATVDDNGVVTTVSGGTTTITVYTDTYKGYPAAEVSYTLTVNATSFTLAFTPTSGKVNVGATITPQMTLPTLMLSDLKTVTASSDNTSVATVPSNLMEKEGGNYKYLEVNEGRVNRFLPIITGEAIGTAHITVSFTSNNYNSTTATYTVEVTAAGTRNFSWADTTPTYTIYTGDFLMMPEISGNSNGNDSYSDGSKKKYVYHIKKGTTEFNNRDYRRYEGVPDFMLVDEETETTDGTHASVFWAQGQGGDYPDVLMVYGKSEGTVKLRAKDPQNPDLYCDATINIVDKSKLATAVNAYVSSMRFPYTWDFTTDFDMSSITANSHYWVEKDDHYYAGNAYFNLDYADEDNDGNTSERFFKYMDAGTTGAQMPLFYGMQVNIHGSSYYSTKIDRLAIKKYTSAGQPRLVVNGGTMQFKLPKAPNQPSSYRIYMKVKTQSGTKISVTGVSKTYAVKSGDYTEGCQLTANSDAIVYFDVNSTASASEGTTLNFDNVYIYWIATSTEAKILNYYKGTNPHLTYAAAAYSYNEDLDLTKSNEVNGGAAYYASSFTTDNNKDAGAFADDGNQYAVVMTPLTIMGNYVTANTGMLLKYDNVSEYTTDTQIPFYMIANPRNVETYSATETIDGTTHKNYLVGTGSGISSLSGHETIESIEYTNFLMAAAYKYYTDVTDASTAQGDYRFDRDWSFYPIMGSGAVPTQRSYLHIPGNLYVNTSGQIVDMPNSARAAFDVDSAADETAEAPATKGALNIVFEEEQPATPDDPATEEPEDGDSDKDKDRPRKPGDDGWPKPPFPPFPPIITDIDSVNTETTDNAVWHSMEGVRISQPTKPGLYIRNGKKVVIK